MIKQVLKTLFAALCLMPLAVIAQDGKAVIDKVVATVGGEIILLSEVQEQLSYAKQQSADLPASYSCIVLQNIIVTKLLVNQAKLDSIDVKDEEVEILKRNEEVES